MENDKKILNNEKVLLIIKTNLIVFFRLEMAREEIELLRQHIDLLLRMRQEDLKVFESTVDKLRSSMGNNTQW